MPILEVRLMEGRTPDQLRAMARRLTEAMVETAAATPQSVQVVIHEVDAEHWAVGGELVSDMRAAAAPRTDGT